MQLSNFITAAILSTSAVLAAENPYSTYPSVAKTATINGFADPIYDHVPQCAKTCLTQNANTGSTPCPYWDTGCLCVMPNFAGAIAKCIADACRGSDVLVATQAAVAACSKAGVWDPYWIYPATISQSLSSAEANTQPAGFVTVTAAPAVQTN